MPSILRTATFVYLMVSFAAVCVIAYAVSQVITTAPPANAWQANNYNWVIDPNGEIGSRTTTAGIPECIPT